MHGRPVDRKTRFYLNNSGMLAGDLYMIITFTCLIPYSKLATVPNIEHYKLHSDNC